MNTIETNKIANQVIEKCCEIFGFEKDDLVRHRRNRQRKNICFRWSIYRLIRQRTSLSYEQIADITGTNQDHATVLHGIRQIKRDLDDYIKGIYNDEYMALVSEAFDFFKTEEIVNGSYFGRPCKIKGSKDIGVLTRQGDLLRVSFPTFDGWYSKEDVEILAAS